MTFRYKISVPSSRFKQCNKVGSSLPTFRESPSVPHSQAIRSTSWRRDWWVLTKRRWWTTNLHLATLQKSECPFCFKAMFRVIGRFFKAESANFVLLEKYSQQRYANFCGNWRLQLFSCYSWCCVTRTQTVFNFFSNRSNLSDCQKVPCIIYPAW
jgi:hypothetical protein